MGETNSNKTCGVAKSIDEDTSIQNFRHIGVVLSEIPHKQYQAFLQKKLEK